MPAWLLRQLDAAGIIDADAGATRTARPARCPRCRRPVIRALDGDMLALAADADPTPITAAGEAIARIAGRPTYELRRPGGRPELDRRDRWRIAGRPAGSTPGVDVLVGHDCDAGPLPAAPSSIPDPADAPPLPDNPPF